METSNDKQQSIFAISNITNKVTLLDIRLLNMTILKAGGLFK